MARVRYVTREDLPEAQRHIYDEIGGPRGGVRNGTAAMLNSPETASRLFALGGHLRYNSQLPAAIRELTIITVAREMDCEYEWAQHRPLAAKAGIGEASISAIRESRAPEGLQPVEAVVVRYAHELMRHHRVSDEVFNPALKQFGTTGLLDLTLLVGYYSMLANALLAMEVELDKGLVPELLR